MTTVQKQMRRLVPAALLAATVALAGCTNDGRLGPTTPTGATDIGGPTMTSAPPNPPDPNSHAAVPESQEQAQDTLLSYVRRTLQGLPPGITFDATRFGGAGSGNVGCDDDATSPDAPIRFDAAGDLKVPPGMEYASLVQTVGDVWRSWGWQVAERDGFRKPNQFGVGPDGYRLRIITSARDGYPPGLEGSSPCFPGNLADNDLPFPPVVEAS